MRYFYTPICVDSLLAAIFLSLTFLSAWILLHVLEWLWPHNASPLLTSDGKQVSLAGLRGLLAVVVVAHHSYFWFYMLRTHTWDGNNTLLFANFGGFGVTLFFFLSGFLFWRKMMRHDSIELRRFYLSRWIRIAPTYYAVLALALLVGGLTVGFRLRVSPTELCASLLTWVLFTLFDRASVNHADMLRITCGVTWTLAYEWLFYLSLPSLAWFSRRPRRTALLAAMLGLLYGLSYVAANLCACSHRMSVFYLFDFLRSYARIMLVGFLGGIATASGERWLRQHLQLSPTLGSLLMLGFSLAYLYTPLMVPKFLLLVPVFALIAVGHNLFGILTTRPVLLLGVLSYPIYLAHGVVLYVLFGLIHRSNPIEIHPYLTIMLTVPLLVLLVAAALHLLVERRTMELSNRVASSRQQNKMAA